MAARNDGYQIDFFLNCSSVINFIRTDYCMPCKDILFGCRFIICVIILSVGLGGVAQQNYLL